MVEDVKALLKPKARNTPGAKKAPTKKPDAKEPIVKKPKKPSAKSQAQSRAVLQNIQAAKV